MRGLSPSFAPKRRGARSGRGVWLVPIACALAASCKPPPATQYAPDEQARARGLAAIENAGCGACHEIPGLEWPRGRLGPSLAGFDDVGLIAGAVPNEFENLARFVRDAPALKPGTAMPPMPLTEAEARDVAAYLYGIDDV